MDRATQRGGCDGSVSRDEFNDSSRVDTAGDLLSHGEQGTRRAFDLSLCCSVFICSNRLTAVEWDTVVVTAAYSSTTAACLLSCLLSPVPYFICMPFGTTRGTATGTGTLHPSHPSRYNGWLWLSAGSHRGRLHGGYVVY